MEIYTKCDAVRTWIPDQHTLWQYQLQEDEDKVAAGYEVRDPQVDFNLPYFAGTLPSGDSLLDTCGEMVYTITLRGGLCDGLEADPCPEIVIT